METEQQDETLDRPAEIRKPYEKPGLAWIQQTEIPANLASACSKFGGQGEPCDSDPGS
jgi:hypothetical protein